MLETFIETLKLVGKPLKTINWHSFMHYFLPYLPLRCKTLLFCAWVSKVQNKELVLLACTCCTFCLYMATSVIVIIKLPDRAEAGLMSYMHCCKISGNGIQAVIRSVLHISLFRKTFNFKISLLLLCMRKSTDRWTDERTAFCFYIRT